MFTYIRAIVKKNEPRALWVEEDIANKPFKEIYQEYREVYFILTSPFHSEEVSLKLSDISLSYKLTNSNLKPQEWLNSLGNVSLAVSDFFPGLDLVYAKYRNAWRAGYDIQPVSRTMHPDIYQDDFDKCDIRLTKDGVDYQRMFDECLVTVNGLFHRTNFVSDALHVIDAGKSGRYANENHVGIYHLGKLGKLTTIPIKEEDIFKGSEDKPLGEKAYITIDTEEDLTNKSVLLCISGYLHYPGKQVNRVGINKYSVDFKNYPLVHRFYEARKTIDYRDIESLMSKSTVNVDQIAVDEIYSDAVIKALLTMSQSFFVIVDTPELHCELNLVEHDGLPGTYIHNEFPVYPVIAGLGKFHDYWVKEEDSKYVIKVKHGLEPNYQFDTTNWRDFISVDPARVTTKTDNFARLFFLKIGKQV